jgi:squalene cyclase
MDRARRRMPPQSGVNFDEAIDRAREWIVGLQSSDGGWAAFDADNTHHYLNHIPFADHGALLDPPTADLTARCVSMLAQLGEEPTTSPALARGIEWLLKDQLADGSWYGRWGMNYIYGTWSVLCALNAAGLEPQHPAMRKAVDWLLKIQNQDGGWGEDGASYKLDYQGYESAPSTPSQTAWALMGLMAAGQARGAFHRDRLPAGLLSPLPRLREVLPAVGDGALPQPQAGQQPASGIRDVSDRDALPDSMKMPVLGIQPLRSVPIGRTQREVASVGASLLHGPPKGRSG